VDVIHVDLDRDESNAEASSMTHHVPEHEGCPALATPLWKPSVFLDPASVLRWKDPEGDNTEDRACLVQHPQTVRMFMRGLLAPGCLLEAPLLIGMAPDASVNVRADNSHGGVME
jgi:hypothetical protein